jgi:broad specificity phosphatase PhoE
MKRLYFIRHGQSVMNVQGVRAGHINTPLTEEGRRQAEKAGQAVKKYGIDTIVCSPLSRTYDTAKIIAKEIGIPEDELHVNSLLIERDFGQFDGQPYDPDIDLDGFSDVESFDETRERAKLAVEWIETLGGSNVLVVSHGGLGRAMRSLLKPDIDRALSLPNAEVEQWL